MAMNVKGKQANLRFDELCRRVETYARDTFYAGSDEKLKEAMDRLTKAIQEARKELIEKHMLILDKDLIPVSKWTPEIKAKMKAWAAGRYPHDSLVRMPDASGMNGWYTLGGAIFLTTGLNEKLQESLLKTHVIPYTPARLRKMLKSTLDKDDEEDSDIEIDGNLFKGDTIACALDYFVPGLDGSEDITVYVGDDLFIEINDEWVVIAHAEVEIKQQPAIEPSPAGETTPVVQQ
jgi:hypothetical protein